jgi:hypothetical protein
VVKGFMDFTYSIEDRQCEYLSERNQTSSKLDINIDTEYYVWCIYYTSMGAQAAGQNLRLKSNKV